MLRYFDDFELDPEGFRLMRAGREVALEPRALDLLRYLAAHPNRLISKDELLTHVWKLQSLSDGVLSNTIGKLRQALGQDARANAPIETVRGRGYRFRPAQTVPPPSAAKPVAAPYIGRKAVLERLSAALSASAAGAGQLLLIAGEAGIGKTRTLEELSERASVHSFKVFSGTAYEGAGAPAYWPWVEVLRTAHTSLGANSFERALPAAASALPVLVPELIERAHEAPDQCALRFRLFDELTRFLSNVSQQAPCLIALDDLQWADPATLELLAYAARALAKRPVLLAASLRAHELPHGSALSKLQRLGTYIQLEGLAECEVSQLVASLGLGSAEVQSALHRRTEGNPFFVRQLVALLLAEREVADVAMLQLPAAVQSVVRQRLQALDANARRTLTAAATIGHKFEANLLAELIEAPVPETLATLQRACDSHVIVREPGALTQFAFGHALLREALYEDASITALGALHAKLVRALEARTSQRDARQLDAIARHALRAVPYALSACLQHCRVAADAARNASGFEVAAELSSLALDKCIAQGGDASTTCELLLRLALDQLCSNDVAAANQTLERGAQLAHSLDRPDLLTGFVCRMIDWLEFTGDEDAARAHLERALAGVAATDLRNRIALLGRAARMSPGLQQNEHFSLAQKLAAELNDPEALIDLAYCRASLRDPTEAKTIGEAIEHYHTLYRRYPLAHVGIRDDMRRLTIFLTEYLAALTRGDFARGDRALARARAAAAACQVPVVDSVLALFSAGRELAAGRLDALEQTVQAQLAALHDAPPQGIQGGWLIYAWLLADARGQLDAWASVDGQVESQLRTMRNLRQQLILRVWLAWLRAHTGRVALAADALHDLAPALLSAAPARYGDLGLLCQAAEVCCVIAAPALAQAFYTRLEPHADCQALGFLGESWGAVAHHLGMLASVRSDKSRMRLQLTAAASAHARWHLPLALARTEAMLRGVAP